MPKKTKLRIDDPQPKSGSSIFLLLLAAVFLLYGLRQTFVMRVQKYNLPRPETQFNRQNETDKCLGSKSLFYHDQRDQLPVVTSANPLEESFGQLKSEVLAEDDPGKREELIAAFTMKIDEVNAPVLLEYLLKSDRSDMATELSHLLIRKWADENPESVARWLQLSHQSTDGIADLAVEWANNNLTNAVIWAQSLPDEADRQNALENVVNETVRTQPLVALQMAVSLPPDAMRDDLIRRAAMEWACSDGAEAVAWAEQIPDSPLRSQVLASEAVSWSKQNPVQAADLALTELPAGRLQDDTVISIIQRWSQSQPEAAASWVEQFPNSPLREAAVQNLIAQWSQSDVVSAQTWLAQHNLGADSL
jgi:hypothetical protein